MNNPGPILYLVQAYFTNKVNTVDCAVLQILLNLSSYWYKPSQPQKNTRKIFKKISRVLRVYGSVQLQKTAAAKIAKKIDDDAVFVLHVLLKKYTITITRYVPA